MTFIQMHWVTTGFLKHQDSCGDHILSVFCGSFPQTFFRKTPLCLDPSKRAPPKKMAAEFSKYPSHMEETWIKNNVFYRFLREDPECHA